MREKEGAAVDLFDGELGGGRDSHGVEPAGSGCSWVTVVIVGILVLLAVLVHQFVGLLWGIF